MQKHDAIKVFGGVSALAKALKITAAAIYQWPDEVPKLRAYQIRELCPAFDEGLPQIREASNPEREAACD